VQLQHPRGTPNRDGIDPRIRSEHFLVERNSVFRSSHDDAMPTGESTSPSAITQMAGSNVRSMPSSVLKFFRRAFALRSDDAMITNFVVVKACQGWPSTRAYVLLTSTSC